MLLACQLLFAAAHPFNKREAPAAPAPPAPPALPASGPPAADDVLAAIQLEGQAAVNGEII